MAKHEQTTSRFSWWGLLEKVAAGVIIAAILGFIAWIFPKLRTSLQDNLPLLLSSLALAGLVGLASYAIWKSRRFSRLLDSLGTGFALVDSARFQCSVALEETRKRVAEIEKRVQEWPPAGQVLTKEDLGRIITAIRHCVAMTRNLQHLGLDLEQEVVRLQQRTAELANDVKPGEATTLVLQGLAKTSSDRMSKWKTLREGIDALRAKLPDGFGI